MVAKPWSASAPLRASSFLRDAIVPQSQRVSEMQSFEYGKRAGAPAYRVDRVYSTRSIANAGEEHLFRERDRTRDSSTPITCAELSLPRMEDRTWNPTIPIVFAEGRPGGIDGRRRLSTASVKSHKEQALPKSVSSEPTELPDNAIPLPSASCKVSDIRSGATEARALRGNMTAGERTALIRATYAAQRREQERKDGEMQEPLAEGKATLETKMRIDQSEAAKTERAIIEQRKARHGKEFLIGHRAALKAAEKAKRLEGLKRAREELSLRQGGTVLNLRTAAVPSAKQIPTSSRDLSLIVHPEFVASEEDRRFFAQLRAMAAGRKLQETNIGEASRLIMTKTPNDNATREHGISSKEIDVGLARLDRLQSMQSLQLKLIEEAFAESNEQEHDWLELQGVSTEMDDYTSDFRLRKDSGYENWTQIFKAWNLAQRSLEYAFHDFMSSYISLGETRGYTDEISPAASLHRSKENYLKMMRQRLHQHRRVSQEKLHVYRGFWRIESQRASYGFQTKMDQLTFAVAMASGWYKWTTETLQHEVENLEHRLAAVRAGSSPAQESVRITPWRTGVPSWMVTELTERNPRVLRVKKQAAAVKAVDIEFEKQWLGFLGLGHLLRMSSQQFMSLDQQCTTISCYPFKRYLWWCAVDFRPLLRRSVSDALTPRINNLYSGFKQTELIIFGLLELLSERAKTDFERGRLDGREGEFREALNEIRADLRALYREKQGISPVPRRWTQSSSVRSSQSRRPTSNAIEKRRLRRTLPRSGILETTTLAKGRVKSITSKHGETRKQSTPRRSMSQPTSGTKTSAPHSLNHVQGAEGSDVGKTLAIASAIDKEAEEVGLESPGTSDGHSSSAYPLERNTNERESIVTTATSANKPSRLTSAESATADTGHSESEEIFDQAFPKPAAFSGSTSARDPSLPDKISTRLHRLGRRKGSKSQPDGPEDRSLASRSSSGTSLSSAERSSLVNSAHQMTESVSTINFKPTENRRAQESTTVLPVAEAEYLSLTYQIPKLVMQKAMLTSGSGSSHYWSHNLYRGPNDEEVSVRYCRSFHTAEREAQYFLGKEAVGFDLEWKPQASHADVLDFRKNVSLIQLACEDRIVLFHVALFKGTSPEEVTPPTLRTVLESQDTLKCGVAVKGDATRLKRFLGIQVKGLFELSHLHNLVMFSQTKPERVNKRLVALNTQAYEHLQLPLQKGAVRISDWSSPLDYQQCNYAAADAYASFRLFYAMEAKRIAMEPRPPRPSYAEEDLPIRLGNGEVAFRDDYSTEAQGVWEPKQSLEQGEENELGVEKDMRRGGLPSSSEEDPESESESCSEYEDASEFLEMYPRESSGATAKGGADAYHQHPIQDYQDEHSAESWKTHLLQTDGGLGHSMEKGCRGH